MMAECSGIETMELFCLMDWAVEYVFFSSKVGEWMADNNIPMPISFAFS